MFPWSCWWDSLYQLSHCSFIHPTTNAIRPDFQTNFQISISEKLNNHIHGTMNERNFESEKCPVIVHFWPTLWYLSSYQLAPNEGAPKSGECFTGHWEVNEAKNGCQSLLHWWIIQRIRKRRYSNIMYCYKKSQDGSSSKMWYILSKVHKSWELLSVKACIAKLLLKLPPLLKICI